MQAERYSNDAVREVAESTNCSRVRVCTEQLRVVEAFVQGSDVFAILPTGYLRLSMAIFKGYLRLSCQMTTSIYRWYSNYDYVITFLQYKSRIRMTPDPRACALEGVASPDYI